MSSPKQQSSRFPQLTPLLASWHQVALPVLGVLVIALAASIFFLLWDRADKPLSTQELTERVGELMELPNELPQVAVVSNELELDPHPLFTHAQNGDQVLFFAESGLAVVYRPTAHKIISVTPVQVSTGLESVQTHQSMPPAKIEILNGTRLPGLAQETREQLERAGISAEFTRLSNARQTPYEYTRVVVFTPGYQAVGLELAALLSGKIEELPAGEASPSADILIIVGAQSSTPTPAASAAARTEE